MGQYPCKATPLFHKVQPTTLSPQHSPWSRGSHFSVMEGPLYWPCGATSRCISALTAARLRAYPGPPLAKNVLISRTSSWRPGDGEPMYTGVSGSKVERNRYTLSHTTYLFQHKRGVIISDHRGVGKLVQRKGMHTYPSRRKNKRVDWVSTAKPALSVAET